jgi:transcriptional regulator with XRE-family HTH domain
MDPTPNSPAAPPDFAELFQQAARHLDYWVEGAILEFTEDVVQRMEEQGISRSALASRLNVRPAYITKILKGENNFTLRKMVEVARSLECELRVHLQREGIKTSWMDYPLLPSARQAIDVPVSTPAHSIENWIRQRTILPATTRTTAGTYEELPAAA